MSTQYHANAMKFIGPVKAALPAHAHINEPTDRAWIGSWTTTAGLWVVSWRDPSTDTTRVEVVGPGLTLRLEYPRSPSLVLHLLTEAGAFVEQGADRA